MTRTTKKIISRDHEPPWLVADDTTMLAGMQLSNRFLHAFVKQGEFRRHAAVDGAIPAFIQPSRWSDNRLEPMRFAQHSCCFVHRTVMETLCSTCRSASIRPLSKRFSNRCSRGDTARRSWSSGCARATLPASLHFRTAHRPAASIQRTHRWCVYARAPLFHLPAGQPAGAHTEML